MSQVSFLLFCALFPGLVDVLSTHGHRVPNGDFFYGIRKRIKRYEMLTKRGGGHGGSRFHRVSISGHGGCRFRRVYIADVMHVAGAGAVYTTQGRFLAAACVCVCVTIWSEATPIGVATPSFGHFGVEREVRAWWSLDFVCAYGHSGEGCRWEVRSHRIRSR